MKIKLIAAAGLSVLAMTGCMVKEQLPTPQTAGIVSTQLSMNSVNVIDAKLLAKKKTIVGFVYDYGKILVESSGAGRTETGTIEAFTTLQNLTDYPLNVQARVRFFDENKLPVEEPSAWQRLYLPAKGIATYKGLSYTTRAAYFYIEVKEGV